MHKTCRLRRVPPVNLDAASRGGIYGKREAIGYALDSLDAFGVDSSTLWVTTFAGDSERGLAPNNESVAEWRWAGIAEDRIVPLGVEDNLWSTGGPGPCGPCTELYVDLGSERSRGRQDCKPGCACDRFLEIWNLVFIEFEETADGRYLPLPFRSVDTGMGLERVALVLQGAETVFETDLFALARGWWRWPLCPRLATCRSDCWPGGASWTTRGRRCWQNWRASRRAVPWRAGRAADGGAR